MRFSKLNDMSFRMVATAQQARVERRRAEILDAAYRVFADQQDKMNLSLIDINGGLLLVPQFTLAANTHKGRRPSFTSAATPALAESVFQAMLKIAQASYAKVESGRFGANMQVQLINDGPVTFILD